MTLIEKIRMSGVSLASLVMLAGCASVNFEQSLANTNREANSFTQGQLSLAQTPDQRIEMARLAQDILSKPVAQGDAVRLALLNSPGVQTLLAQNWADATRAAQTGRIANPLLTLDRLRRVDELELGRLLSFGLLDLLSLPQRMQISHGLMAQQQLSLTSQVIDQITQVRQAWVKAVAAQQSLNYAAQVNDAAQVSSELAKRMQAAGNFNKLQRARQQAFYADAATQWAGAQHAASSKREELVRLLGLSESQADALVLPERLPDLPSLPRSTSVVSQLASKGRLDIRLAHAEFETQTKAQGLKLLTSLTDIELGVRRDTVFDNAAGTSNARRGYEISVRLPIFDWGGHQRDAMNAQTLAAGYRLEDSLRKASSNLRESYSAYRTAFDLSKHYRDEVVPLRKTISEENLLRYNGMLIGVFELLVDTRDQINTVRSAIAAEQQFWLADAALQASIMGKPTPTAFDPIASDGGRDAKH
ncbi:MAG: TolC family protein [Burkholderiaceae bacterium]